MGATHAARVRDALIARGLPGERPVALIESASCAEENVIRGVLGDLPALAGRLGDGPAIIVLGEVAARAGGALEAVKVA